MPLNVHAEVRAMMKAPMEALRERYEKVFGEPTRSGNRLFLVKRIAWRLQANEEGDLSERARKRAEELVRDSDVRLRPPKAPADVGGLVIAAAFTPKTSERLPMPGALITREYKGRTIAVRILARGFEYEGKVYRSLSAVAKKVTGSHWNGPLFFGLKPPGNKKEDA